MVDWASPTSSSDPLLQPIWTLALKHHVYVSSPLFPIVLSIGCYFASVVPFTVLDFYGYRHWTWVQRLKIQPDVQVSWCQVRGAMSLTFWNQLLYVLPISVAQCVWTPSTYMPPTAPSIWQIVWQPFAALAIFDAEYYIWHVVHHRVRWLYRNVHSVHHHYAAVNAWLGQFVHPWELISAGIFGTTAPWILNLHPLTTWVCLALLQFVSVEDHCGYDLPVMPHRWVPEIWGGAVKHDMHHQRPMTNFQPFFTWFDRLFGTECPGQTAGGRKPSTLVDWERQEQLKVKAMAALEVEEHKG
jgi:cholesterol 25-hydroxylase